MRICKILVVEDDQAVRTLLGDILDYQGYLFALADSAAEMREALDNDDYDVVIIDVSLRAEEDGFKLAELASDRGCGVILTTGDPTQLARLQASGRHHVLKPFRVQELTELVEQVLKDTAALCVPRRAGDGSSIRAGA